MMLFSDNASLEIIKENNSTNKKLYFLIMLTTTILYDRMIL